MSDEFKWVLRPFTSAEAGEILSDMTKCYRPEIIPGPGVYGRARWRDITGVVVRMSYANKYTARKMGPREWITIWTDASREAGYYEEITGKIAQSITEEELNPTDASFHVGSLKTIRQERLEIRGELTPIQERKHQLDIEKFEHKKYVDLENLKIRKRGKDLGGTGEEPDVEYVD